MSFIKVGTGRTDTWVEVNCSKLGIVPIAMQPTTSITSIDNRLSTQRYAVESIEGSISPAKWDRVASYLPKGHPTCALGIGRVVTGVRRYFHLPYVSIKSTKSISPQKDKTKEGETIKQRQEAGIRAGVSFFRLFRFTLGVGQSKLTTTEKVSEAKDEYGEIDYEEDLDMSTDDPDNEIKIIETQNVGKASLIIDPGFWIFIARAKAGVTARQRILETEETGKEPSKHEPPITYKPHSGFGLGVKLGYGTYFMAEYEFYHYKFPEIEPFEREVSVSFSVSI